MKEHAAWRLAFARALSARLRHRPGIAAIAVGGSVARGYSDSYSDLELILVWQHQPGPELRQAIMHDLEATYRYPAFDPGHASALLIRDVPVDIWHMTIDGLSATIQTVLHEYSIDLVASNMVETMGTCIPLYGAERVHPWKRAIERYPDELAIRYLQTYLPHFHLRQLNLAARRNNPTVYYHTLTDIQCSLFLVLLALNRSYFPTFKWIYPTLEQLPIGPPHVAARLQQMFHEPPLRAAAQLREVLAETITIAETAYPQLDTAYPRFGLDQEPREYTEPRTKN